MTRHVKKCINMTQFLCQYIRNHFYCVGRKVLSSALPVVSIIKMTFHEVGAPAGLSGVPSANTNISREGYSN